MSTPTAIVCAGGGGVGKTTTSAALSVALAKAGRRVLIVSLDPARRLADALGAELGSRARELSVDAGDGALFGLMPDPQDALARFVELLAGDDPELTERLRNNSVYRALEASVPGVHELVSINLTWGAIAEHEIDTVVIDTAPSRNAMDFITYPKRLAKLLGGRAIGWMTGLGQRAARGGRMGRVDRLLAWAIGPVVSDVAEFFAELARVRERFVWLNERVSRLLLDRNAHYFLVAAPTAAASDDAQYLFKRLKALRVSPRALVLNSAYLPENEWIEVLEEIELESDELRAALSTLREESEIREKASDAVSGSFSARHPSLPQLRLPYVELPEPREIVLQLSRQLDVTHLLAV
jgi:anion-transporting  ArsA/GET3 family ATPase